ncbi:MAG: hypothetical protein ACOYMH_06275 [Zwartia sp.]|jgi:hypothetical protein
MTDATTQPVAHPEAGATNQTSAVITPADPDVMVTAPLEAEGPAFTALIKLLASVLVGALIVWGARASRVMDWQAFSLSAGLVWVAALAIVLVVYYWLLKSRTSIKNGVIEQTWVWKKSVNIADIRQAKFIYLPALSWLIAPRLIVRTGPVMTVFYTAHPEVQRAFAALMLGR